MAQGPEGPPPPWTRLGVFGGTFDPPHRGHVAVAADVADALGLDRVLWIPSGSPPHKSDRDVTPGDVRLAMVRAAVAQDPRFMVDTCELERMGPSYTVDTLRSLRARYPGAELFLLLGADQYTAFGTWRSPLEISRLARLAVMDRDGESARNLLSPVERLPEPCFVPVRRVDVSSTQVRERAAAREDIAELVPPGVAIEIREHDLYGGREPRTRGGRA